MSINTTNEEVPTKVLLLTRQLQPPFSGGRELLCKLTHDALKETYGDRLVVFELPIRQWSGLRSIINAFRGHIDGLNDIVIAEVIRTIRTENVSKLFVDGSNLGGLVAVAKDNFPQLEISTFFHNAEARFFLGSLKQTKSIRALAVLVVNYLAERKAVRYSDKIISLSERDSGLLKRLYGRSATHISPMAMQDKAPAGLGQNSRASDEKFALFVGGGFYANRAGIAWFVENVTPRINMKTYIVGRGLEDMKKDLDRDGKVEVVGAVESLADWYMNAHVVIAPIFDGSGMKTKVAEALMFGKKIIGSPEAFSGYDNVAEQAGWECETADEFVAAFVQAETMITKSYDPELRSIYEDNYSYEAARKRLEEILR
jgi:glycosyltransferase involved in cell wall biosynthesis